MASGVVAPQPLQWDCVWLGVCVYSTTGCTAESSRGALVALCTPVLLDCRGRREKRWEWQPKLTPHTCVGV